jgi:hypothetical protein
MGGRIKKNDKISVDILKYLCYNIDTKEREVNKNG